jgi:hypothetical protein
MPDNQTKPLLSFPLAAILMIAFAAAGTGCGNSPAPEPSGSAARAKTNSIAVRADAGAEEAADAVPRSMFTATKGARDPFFPQATPVAQNEPGSAKPQQAVDVAALLQEGLQWIAVTASDRLALVNNVVIEPNKTAQIPITAGGQQQLITVRCIDIQKNSVTLAVPGRSEPVTLTSVPKK